MSTVNIQLDLDELIAAIKRLPKSQKIQLWQALDAELNRDEINRELAQALEETWTANEHHSEAEVNADIETALREVRESQATHRS
jgi:hypothetical protein